MKQAPTAQVLKAIREVLRGEICVSDEMRSRLLGKFHPGARDTAAGVEQLSDRELEVFRLLGEGRGTSEIAKKMHVSVSTVETYRAHIKEKLGLANAMDLVSTAVRWVQEHP
jgi:DNA-binding NarL/FixJ family response regulator